MRIISLSSNIRKKKILTNQVIIQIKTRILISSYLAFFATVVDTINISGCWCHWCNLSTKSGLINHMQKEFMDS